MNALAGLIISSLASVLMMILVIWMYLRVKKRRIMLFSSLGVNVDKFFRKEGRLLSSVYIFATLTSIVIFSILFFLL